MSEKSLDQLIQTLKTEAIENAEKESARIIQEAHNRAEEILADAKNKERKMLDDARKEADDILNKGKRALKVAARDLSLEARNDILGLLDNTFKRKVRDSFKSDVLHAVVMRVVENIGRDAEVRLPEKEMDDLASYVQQALQNSDAGISLTRDPGLLNAITIKKKDEGWSYDITAEQISEAILPHLNSKWSDILTDNFEDS